MAESITIARPYARAAFEAAQQAGDGGFARWSEMLSAAASAAVNGQMQTVLASPEHDSGFKAGLILDLMGERLDQSGSNFIRLLAENQRLNLLPEIAESYEEFRAEAERTVDAEVISAFEISDEQRHRISAALSQRLQRDVQLNCRVDSSLIAGAIIRAGDLVVDGSASGKLSQLSHQLRQ